MRQRYNNIDLFKLIFAIIVITIHTRLFSTFSETLDWYYLHTLANLAVPFFFMASGFLLFNKLESYNSDRKWEYVKSYVKHILKMYIVWCIIWIPWKALNFYNMGQFNIEDFFGYVRDLIFVSGGDALWYLIALAFSVVLLYFLYRKFPLKVVVVIAILFYLIGYFICNFYDLAENLVVVQWYYKVFKTTQNGLFYGFLFLTMGALVAITGKNNYEEGKYKFYVVPSAVSFVVMILETVMLKNLEMGYGNLTTQLFLPITSYYLFNLILSIKLKDRPIYSNFREMSILLYLSHCFIIRSINMLYAILGHTKGSGINLFMETLVVATAFSYMVMKLSKNKMKWLKVLY